MICTFVYFVHVIVQLYRRHEQFQLAVSEVVSAAGSVWLGRNKEDVRRFVTGYKRERHDGLLDTRLSRRTET